MYVILQGTVSVVVSDQKNIEENQNKHNKHFHTNTNARPVSEQQLKKIIEQMGNKINTFKKGDNFGEKALMVKKPEDARRGATIIADSEKLILLIAKREQFYPVLEKIQQDQNQKKLLMIKHIPLQDNKITNYLMEQLCYYFREAVLDKDEIIVKQDQQGEKVFFLEKGEISIYKKIKYLDPLLQGEKEISIQIQQQDQRGNIVIGDEIVFGNQENSCNYDYTVKVTSNSAILYYIQKKYMKSLPTESLKQMKKNFENVQKKRKDFVKFVKEIKEQSNDSEDYSSFLMKFDDVSIQNLIRIMSKNAALVHKQNTLKRIYEEEQEQGEEFNKLTKMKPNFQQSLKNMIAQHCQLNRTRENVLEHCMRKKDKIHKQNIQKNFTDSYRFKGNAEAKEIVKQLFSINEDVRFNEQSEINQKLVEENLIGRKNVIFRKRKFYDEQSLQEAQKKIEKTILKESYKDIGMMGLNQYEKSNYFRCIQKGLVKPALYETKINNNSIRQRIGDNQQLKERFSKSEQRELKRDRSYCSIDISQFPQNLLRKKSTAADFSNDSNNNNNQNNNNNGDSSVQVTSANQNNYLQKMESQEFSNLFKSQDQIIKRKPKQYYQDLLKKSQLLGSEQEINRKLIVNQQNLGTVTLQIEKSLNEFEDSNQIQQMRSGRRENSEKKNNSNKGCLTTLEDVNYKIENSCLKSQESQSNLINLQEFTQYELELYHQQKFDGMQKQFFNGIEQGGKYDQIQHLRWKSHQNLKIKFKSNKQSQKNSSQTSLNTSIRQSMPDLTLKKFITNQK